jgi:hypothetical protein
MPSVPCGELDECGRLGHSPHACRCQRAFARSVNELAGEDNAPVIMHPLNARQTFSANLSPGECSHRCFSYSSTSFLASPVSWELAQLAQFPCTAMPCDSLKGRACEHRTLQPGFLAAGMRLGCTFQHFHPSSFLAALCSASVTKPVPSHALRVRS